ncbi:MAG: hypothetical protein LAP85_27985, partial [Acidobacteriia bacterium]|nr:hypothetical protein [Terriglobia bacterium]
MHFVWREACGPQLAKDLTAEALVRKLIGRSKSGLRPKSYPLTLEKTHNSRTSSVAPSGFVSLEIL